MRNKLNKRHAIKHFMFKGETQLGASDNSSGFYHRATDSIIAPLSKGKRLYAAAQQGAITPSLKTRLTPTFHVLHGATTSAISTLR